MKPSPLPLLLLLTTKLLLAAAPLTGPINHALDVEPFVFVYPTIGLSPDEARPLRADAEEAARWRSQQGGASNVGRTLAMPAIATCDLRGLWPVETRCRAKRGSLRTAPRHGERRQFGCGGDRGQHRHGELDRADPRAVGPGGLRGPVARVAR
jgi:hypothetical protein